MGIVSQEAEIGGDTDVGVLRAVKATGPHFQKRKFKHRAVWPNQTIP